MAIKRYENVVVNDLTFGTDLYGEYTTTITPKFTTRPLVSDVKNSLAITERYRVYQDLIQLHGELKIGVLLMLLNLTTGCP